MSQKASVSGSTSDLICIVENDAPFIKMKLESPDQLEHNRHAVMMSVIQISVAAHKQIIWGFTNTLHNLQFQIILNVNL